jgi:RNA recognition motif-containing protein
VGNLLYTVKSEHIRSVFEEAGFSVDRIEMSMDPITARNPSYCFVEFTDSFQAGRAMEAVDGTPLFDRPMKVRPCQPHDNSKHCDRPQLVSRWDRDSVERRMSSVEKENRRLFVAGLPKPLNQPQSDKVIQGLFEGFQM